MNEEFNLKLQACLDGELEPREARKVEAQVGLRPEAQALLGELRATRAALRGNEPERALPETREFYWSKIERAIEAAEAQPRPQGNRVSLGWLLRYWPQLGGATAAALLALAAVLHFHMLSPAGWVDIESSLDETGTFCFRSEPDRMTLVWVYDQAPAQETEPDALN
jgi:anti-sigma factor RsiW